ncbi:MULTISPECIES: lysine N(6)-hydroxylase/L-ornithine N(5)-oxygenase family protein [unclassified Agarivorans]|uniref:lysine N(6)-hydroxylase/L-ornithine N(5)-oxygenase family protein n=1 Tax=unclassified Agarivorans TaxID=2636026 RepID=UPI003D7E90DB
MMNTPAYDLLGIGIGPFNLSIAALASSKAQLSTLFLEKQARFAWHPGMLLSDAKMQTSYLKDLVTSVDPTNPYSFLNYLVSQQKLYPFIASGQSVISRLEFSDYLSWAAQALPNTQFDHEVQSVSFEQGRFTLETKQQRLHSRHLVIGTGTRPKMPDFCQALVNDTCFHASELGLRKPNLSDKRVAIIGGGQSGADIFQHVFDGEFGKVSQLTWVSRRPNIEVLDESCFTDQYFMPDYVNGFYSLQQDIKNSEVARQKFTSDGITNDCLLSIYQRLYHDRYVLRNPPWWSIQPNRSLTSLSDHNTGYQLQLKHGLNQNTTQLDADVVILCTGYQRALPPCIAELSKLFERDTAGQIQLNADFDVNWQGPSKNRIYMVNAGLHSHGIAEPQLSLASWRAAKILNHASEQSLYKIEEKHSMIDWGLSPSSLASRHQSATLSAINA